MVSRLGKLRGEENVDESCCGEYVAILRLCKYFVMGNNKSDDSGPIDK